MTIENEKACVKAALMDFKEAGLDVYMSQTDTAYGFITDGTDILNIQYSGVWGYAYSYPYVPSRKNGTGVAVEWRAFHTDVRDRKLFDQCVAYGKGCAFRFGATLLSAQGGDVVQRYLEDHEYSHYEKC